MRRALSLRNRPWKDRRQWGYLRAKAWLQARRRRADDCLTMESGWWKNHGAYDPVLRRPHRIAQSSNLLRKGPKANARNLSQTPRSLGRICVGEVGDNFVNWLHATNLIVLMVNFCLRFLMTPLLIFKRLIQVNQFKS